MHAEVDADPSLNTVRLSRSELLQSLLTLASGEDSAIGLAYQEQLYGCVRSTSSSSNAAARENTSGNTSTDTNTAVDTCVNTPTPLATTSRECALVQALVGTVRTANETSLRAVLGVCLQSKGHLPVSDRLIKAPVGVMYLVVRSILAFDSTCAIEKEGEKGDREGGESKSHIGLLWDLIECTPSREALEKVSRAGGYVHGILG